MSLANVVLSLPPELVADLALGLESPTDIAQRHGISSSDFMALQTQPWFQDAIIRKRQQLADAGQVFREKARLMHEDLARDVYMAAKANILKPSETLDLLKHLAEIGDLKPKQQQIAAGPGFKINIVLPTQTSPGGIQIDTTTEAQPSYVDTFIEGTPPTLVNVTDLKTLDDLSANV